LGGLQRREGGFARWRDCFPDGSETGDKNWVRKFWG